MNTSFTDWKDENYLAHYGVPGMKWGIRRAGQGSNKNQAGSSFNPYSQRTASNISSGSGGGGLPEEKEVTDETKELIENGKIEVSNILARFNDMAYSKVVLQTSYSKTFSIAHTDYISEGCGMDFTSWECSAYLEHHGIIGQKWGVRRYQNPDGTLTSAGKKHYRTEVAGGSNRLSRKYNKQLRKLNRLEKKADVDIQSQKAAKYDKRAKIGLKVAGVGAAIAGAGAAAEYGGANLRNQLVSKALQASRDKEWDAHNINKNNHMDEWLYWEDQRRKITGNDVGDWNKIYDYKQQKSYERYAENQKGIANAGVSERRNINANAALASQIHKGVMAAGTTTAIVGVGMAAVNKLMARNARKRMTEIGHLKAVHNYQVQVNKMATMFRNTPYSELVKKQKKNVQ